MICSFERLNSYGMVLDTYTASSGTLNPSVPMQYGPYEAAWEGGRIPSLTTYWVFTRSDRRTDRSV